MNSKNTNNPTLPESIVDFHVHLFPDKGFDAIWAYFKNFGADVHYKYYTPQCIDYLNERGVGTIVFSNYAHKKGIAEPMNDWNIDLLDRYPHLYCFAAYHPDDDNALKYTARILSHPRVAGIKLHFMVQKFYPHDERLFPMYEMVMENNKRLLLHTGNGPTGNGFVGFRQFKKALDRYPDLPANIPHMGGYEFREFIDLLDGHPNLFLDTAYSFWPDLPFTFNLGAGRLERHRNRILYGSDFPNVILPREGEIDYLLSLGLSEDFYRCVFHDNATALLKQICPGMHSQGTPSGALPGT